MSLNSLHYSYYFAKTGLYAMVGAETAQGLPNANLFYALLRGAAKTFAALLWGNVSFYNRFGFKTCNTTGCIGNGTSLALMKRLMYLQLLMGVSIFGFEGGIFANWTALTPIEHIQAKALEWK